MGKKVKKAESVKKEVSATVQAATQRIKVLCVSKGLTPVDTYAVMKELVKAASSVADVRFTRWAETADGERCLVVLNKTYTAIKVYPDYATKFSSIRTLKA